MMRRVRTMWESSGRFWPGYAVVAAVILVGVSGYLVQRLLHESSDVASELTWHWLYDRKGRLAEVLGPGSVSTRITYAESEAETGGVVTSIVKIPAASCGAFREPHQTSSVAHFEDFSGTGYTDE
jgi:hypothetical protein